MNLTPTDQRRPPDGVAEEEPPVESDGVSDTTEGRVTSPVTVQDRFDDIVMVVDNLSDGAVQDAELVKLLLDPMKGTHAQREQQAFKRLLRGYACSYNTLVSATWTDC